jgi:type I restriction enzyme M protein
MRASPLRREAEIRAEHLLTEMLKAQGWDVRRPPAGDLLRQQEYKVYPHLLAVFRGRSKSGRGGDALPEGVLLDKPGQSPLAVIEVKARADDLAAAEADAEHYGAACIEAGYTPLVIALAGADEDDFKLRVRKWNGNAWRTVTYDGQPIGWIPNRADTQRLIVPDAPSEIRPTAPPVDVLAEKGEEINRLLRESGIKDEFRPAVVGAIMLALWQSRGRIRKEPEFILHDINTACAQAFWNAKKPDLAKSIQVDAANDALARNARRIVAILERLNVTVLTAEHDYLGHLYEAFFRYTGGNTIGQYFTPRHVAELMADLTDVHSSDITLDPACGTGGFLIAVMNRIARIERISKSQVIQLIQSRLIGFDQEPITAALCVANMILRGDGSTSVHRGDSFTSPEYPVGQATVVLTNPPFPHKKTDTPPEAFIQRALEGLQARGRLAVLVPTSLLVKADKAKWREWLATRNTIEGIISFERELWHRYADSVTSILLLTKGIPHPAGREVFFAKIKNDGFRVIKQVRTPVPGSQLPEVLKAYQERRTIPGLCGWVQLGSNWGPGLYVPAVQLTTEEVLREVYYLARSQSAAAVARAPQLFEMQIAISEGAVDVRPIEAKKGLLNAPLSATIGGYFDVLYGQRELHSKRDLKPGPCLAISAQGTNNGWYGFFDLESVLGPPFVTVPSTGSIGQAHVQRWPCGVTDDCLILVPKKGAATEILYIAAAVIRSERWRFNYGMKATPARIRGYPLPTNSALLSEVTSLLSAAERIERLALEAAEDEHDARVARECLEDIAAGTERVIEGAALEERLAALDE